MDQPDKLPLLKQSFGLLVEQSRSWDKIAIVVYAGAAGLVLPSTEGDGKEAIMNAINDLQAGGSTAGGEGIQLAYKTAKEDFADDTKDAGELGAGHSVTALYEIIPVGSNSSVRRADDLRYQETRLSHRAGQSSELMTVKLRYQRPEGGQSILMNHPVVDKPVAFENTSDNFRFSAAVAEFGLLLRDSRCKGQAAYSRVQQAAEAAKGRDSEGYRSEFIQLIKTAELLGAVAKHP